MPGRDYQAPGAEFTPIPDADIAVGQPITSFLMGEVRDGAYHSRDVLYNPDLHEPELAHNHNGLNSAHIVSAPQCPNLITAGIVHDQVDFDENEWNTGRRWKFGNTEPNQYGIPLSTGNQWAAHVLTDVDRPRASASIFGGRCDLVVSVWLYGAGDLTGGVLQFGIYGASEDNADVGRPVFPEGLGVWVPASVVPNGSWARYWAVLDNVGPELTGGSVRFGIRCSESTSGGGVYANAFDVRPGRSLDHYVHGYVSTPYYHFTGYGFQNTPPVLDETLGITNAVELGAQ